VQKSLVGSGASIQDFPGDDEKKAPVGDILPRKQSGDNLNHLEVDYSPSSAPPEAKSGVRTPQDSNDLVRNLDADPSDEDNTMRPASK
jgi:hypothetical protein